MVAWGWLIMAYIAGTWTGVLVAALIVAGHHDDD